MDLTFDTAVQSVRIALELLVFRATPAFLFVQVTPAAQSRARVIAALLYGSLFYAAMHLGVPAQRLASGALPLLVLGLVALCIYPLRGALRSGALTPGGLFALCLLGFLLLPSLLLPAHLLTPMLGVGWDLSLAGYSYVTDTAAPRRAPSSLADCLFFLLVNPTLSYVERGHQEAEIGFSPQGLARIGIGFVAVCGQSLVRSAGAPLGALLMARGLPAYPIWLARYGTRVVAATLSHSGLASIHIGLMRMLGLRIPERYNYPLLATSPQDFWRRWNIWIGRWAQRYLFHPLALACTRRLRGSTGKLLAALLTFAAVGAFHDVFRWVQQRDQGEVTLRWTLGFLLLGLIFVVWLGLQKPLTKLGDRLGVPRRLRAVCGWAAFLHLLMLVIDLINPESTPGILLMLPA